MLRYGAVYELEADNVKDALNSRLSTDLPNGWIARYDVEYDDLSVGLHQVLVLTRNCGGRKLMSLNSFGGKMTLTVLIYKEM